MTYSRGELPRLAITPSSHPHEPPARAGRSVHTMTIIEVPAEFLAKAVASEAGGKRLEMVPRQLVEVIALADLLGRLP